MFITTEETSSAVEVRAFDTFLLATVRTPEAAAAIAAVAASRIERLQLLSASDLCALASCRVDAVIGDDTETILSHIWGYSETKRYKAELAKVTA